MIWYFIVYWRNMCSLYTPYEVNKTAESSVFRGHDFSIIRNTRLLPIRLRACRRRPFYSIDTLMIYRFTHTWSIGGGGGHAYRVRVAVVIKWEFEHGGSFKLFNDTRLWQVGTPKKTTILHDRQPTRGTYILRSNDTKQGHFKDLLTLFLHKNNFI